MIPRLSLYFTLAWALLLDQSFADPAIWRHVISRGEGVSDIAIDPARPETVYTVSRKTVFRSTDGGDSWEPVFNARESLLHAVKCSRTEPGTVYTWGFMQIFKSTDSGENWELIFGEGHWIERFVVADAMPQRLYAVIRVGTFEFLRSDDGGVTWTKLPVDGSGYCGMDIAVSGVDADTVYSSGGCAEGSEFFKSQDGGETWHALRTKTYSGLNRIVTHPIRPDSVYIFYGGSRLGAGVIASSRDGGQTWRFFVLDPGSWDIPGVWFDPLRPNVLYAGTYSLKVDSTTLQSPFVYQSVDGGETWALAPFNLDLFNGPAIHIHDIQFHPTQTGVIYLSAGSTVVGGLACQGTTGLFKSRDGGMTWRRLPNRSNFGWIQLDAGGRFAYMSDAYKHRSQSHNYWRLDLRKNEMKSLLPDTCDEIHTSVAVSPIHPHHLIAYQDPPSAKLEIITSQNAGYSWKTLSEDPPGDGASPVSWTIDPTDANTIYLCSWFLLVIAEPGASGNIYKTTDGGQTWIELKEGLPVYSQAYVQTLISPSAPKTVYLLAHDVNGPVGQWSRIYRSDDGGARWRQMPLPGVLESKQEWIQEMAVSPQHPNFLYVMTNEFRFFESTVDRVWIEKSQGLPPKSYLEGHTYPRIINLIPDPRIPERLYAAIITGNRKHPHSVYVKPNADSPWQTYSSGLEAVEANDLFIDPVNRMLYAATTAGIYSTPLYETAVGFQPYLHSAIAESRLFQNYP
ncbi:MAG: hypothetical protein O7E52_04590, partial [Candidatus Poribacteria bacterium]|nr:hypothetical protein [Candidatus Poribacteria bacterium]